MSADARFEDAVDRPLRLRADTEDDLAVISALVQDAVAQARGASWMPKRRRFTVLLNRFRWEDAARARAEGRPFERVRSILTVDCALRARAQGVDPNDRDAVLALLSLRFAADGEGGGTVVATLAGGGVVAVDVECLDVALVDVSRPYLARAGAAPAHPET